MRSRPRPQTAPRQRHSKQLGKMYSPQALHATFPSPSLLHKGVVFVPQFEQDIAPTPSSSGSASGALGTVLAPGYRLLKEGQPWQHTFPPWPLQRPSPGHEPGGGSEADGSARAFVALFIERGRGRCADETNCEGGVDPDGRGALRFFA
jgi:hypothetical protein